jgi:hypothetical protein
MAHRHAAILTDTAAFTGPVAHGENPNPAAHGNVVHHQTCLCGARRRLAVNGRHTEDSGWDLPEWVADTNPEACSYRADDARRLLVALAGSDIGRESIRRALGNESASIVLRAPERGDDYSVLRVAALAWRELRRGMRATLRSSAEARPF